MIRFELVLKLLYCMLDTFAQVDVLDGVDAGLLEMLETLDLELGGEDVGVGELLGLGLGWVAFEGGVVY
jgi:hypothetical protein